MFLDIDECATYGHNCSQICVNMEGNYHCTCHIGFEDYGGHCAANGKY